MSTNATKTASNYGISPSPDAPPTPLPIVPNFATVVAALDIPIPYQQGHNPLSYVAHPVIAITTVISHYIS